jgi:competence protein ComEA
MKILEDIQFWWDELTFSHTQKRSLLIIAAVVVVASGAYVVRPHASQEIAAPPLLEIESSTATVVVDVAGAVANPGVYTLPANSRVIDAITAAGNIKKGADTSDLNLARVIRDGEQVYVYPKGSNSYSSSTSSSKTKAVRRGPIPINRANAKELDALDGIGPVIAARIVAYRNTNGPFLTLEDLMKVSGIGEAKFAQFKEKITL